MGKLYRAGKIVLVLQGRFAGRKAVIVTSQDKGADGSPFGRCLVAGIDKYPRKVHKRMNPKLKANRSRVRPFLKVFNHSHIMPTRFALNVQQDFKGKIAITEPSKKKQSLSTVRKVFQERYAAGKHRWFFEKLRF
eukprot:TRINITY_DN568_c0_g2_i1.p3 TRINITY_DN568_c0_g2~~TRINITY_DN568_c0_g2_i1.p3  ORF type:complete len:143 (-),score=32.80 TRINITY_DN568_c0_g2_i1:846-1250(-)